MIYIHKNEGFYRSEPLTSSYYVGETIDDYNNGAYIALSNEQVAFYLAHLDATQMEVWNMELIPIPEPEPEPDAIQEARLQKVWAIMEYDRSETVNSFSVNGVLAWLTPDVRANYRNSIEAAELLGETTITFLIAGIVATSTLLDARMMLAKIQRYADKCTIVTETHKAIVGTLPTVEEISTYDYMTGYPEKETFSIIPQSTPQ